MSRHPITFRDDDEIIVQDFSQFEISASERSVQDLLTKRAQIKQCPPFPFSNADKLLRALPSIASFHIFASRKTKPHLFADSAFRSRSIKIRLLSIVTSYLQLMGYGAGFMAAFIKRIILVRESFRRSERIFTSKPGIVC